MTQSNCNSRISEMRNPYETESTFDISGLVSKEPYGVFKDWFDDTCNISTISEPNAMILATATREGKPSSRTVLLKGYDNTGFWFFSNYESRKGQELEENPQGSLLFYWCNMYDTETKVWSRQVRIEGHIEKMSEKQSTEYFHQRPRGSQIGACVSKQSTVIPNRQVLDEKQTELEELYQDEAKVIPKPEHWGGYVLRPDWFEFWQGRPSRLHDRIVFRQQKPGESIDHNLTVKGDNDWLIERLSP